MASFKSILKKIGKGALSGLDLLASFGVGGPIVRAIDALVDKMEDDFGDTEGSGMEKHERVLSAALAGLEKLPLTDAQRASAKEAVDKAIVATVAQRNATRDLKDAYEAVDALWDSFKKPSTDE